MKEQDESLRNGKLGKLLFKYATPCVISLLITSLYNVVDQLFIGNTEGLGVVGNSATTIIFPLTILALAIALLIGDGVASYLSQGQGQRDTLRAQKAIAVSLILGLAVSAVYSVLGLVLMDKLVWWLGASEENYQMAMEYGYIIMAGMVFSIFTNILNSPIRSDGSPIFAMIAQGSGALINIILDPVFLFVFKTGIAGAAYATIIGQAVSALLSVGYLFKSKTFRIHLRDFKDGWKYLGHTLALGVSSFFIQLSLVVVTIVSNVVLNNVCTGSPTSAEALAVFGITYKVFTIVVNIGVGIALGGVPIIAYNYGAKQYKRCIKTYNYVLLSTLVVMVVSMLVFEIWPDAIVSLFGSDTSAAYQEFAVKMFRIYLLAIIFTGTQRTTSVFFQAVGKPIQGTVMSLSRDFIFLVPLTFILSYSGMGVDGFLWAAPIADVIAFVLSTVLVLLEYRRLNHLAAEEESRLKTEENKAVEKRAA